MMRNLFLTAAALCALAAPVMAQGPAADQADVIITAPEQRDKQIRDYVRALANVPGRDPMARFDRTTLCPGAVGLSPARNAEIAARMRVVAKAAGIAVSDKADCKPNALVIFASDKEAMVAALEKAHPAYFRDAYGTPIRTPKQAGPATAWHLEGRLDRSGTPVAYNADTGQYELNSPLPPSRISATVRPIFIAAVVVIQLDAAIGLSPVQLADYAAMRTFAQTDPEKVKGLSAPTILTILDAPDDAEVPVTLTKWDLGYLRGLYAAAPMRSAATQRDEIKRGISGDLDKAAGGK
ncbi:hypothetical protein [Sphingomonas sp. CCH9-H8]|uniref:hypothetical protein n=2 Tax=unclassified Sphingomonas TaxID=196159 RepID=UPI000835869F|nr:hypothetical protein [Sphingomonas sp. CCH9-H8]